MPKRESFLDQKKADKLNEKIYQRGSLDREHLMEFLTCIDTNDARDIINEVKHWLKTLHSNPKYTRIVFPRGDIDSILGDLDSYGRVRTETIQEFKNSSSRTLPIS